MHITFPLSAVLVDVGVNLFLLYRKKPADVIVGSSAIYWALAAVVYAN